jgi:hypothetical protein
MRVTVNFKTFSTHSALNTYPVSQAIFFTDNSLPALFFMPPENLSQGNALRPGLEFDLP